MGNFKQTNKHLPKNDGDKIPAIFVFLFYALIGYGTISYLCTVIPLIGLINALGIYISVTVLYHIIKDILNAIKEIQKNR